MSEALIARIWHTEVDPARADEYEAFARDISLPMFRAQPGFAGVLMLRDGGRCQVITLWETHEAIEALDSSAKYRETVDSILAQGFLGGEQRVELLDAHLFFVDKGVS
jgi:heme-degrading monooxygenase HmoA